MTPTTIHPHHVRIAHWINAAIMLIMLWSGFAMLVTNRGFAFYVHLIPTPIWNALQLTGHRLEGRAWHLAVAIMLIANAVFYGLASLATGTIHRIAPQRTWLRDAWDAIIEEITGRRPPGIATSYNGMQRLTYSLVMVGGLVMILSGLSLWFGHRFPILPALFGGGRNALVIHVICALGLLAYIGIHLVQVARAGIPTLVAMLTGQHHHEPLHTQRALAWSICITTLLVVGFVSMNAFSGPTGVPSFLRWLVPARSTTTALHFRNGRLPR